MPSWHGRFFRVTGPLWPVHSPHKGPVMRSLTFLWRNSVYDVKQTVEWLVTWDYMTVMWRHCNDWPLLEHHDTRQSVNACHDDVIKWNHFPRYWPFAQEIHRSRWIPRTQRPVTRSFDVFFDLRLNKRLSKQPWGWWFETPPWSLWRQCNVYVLGCSVRVSDNRSFKQLDIFKCNYIKVHSGYGLNQRPDALLCNAFSLWPIPYPEWFLYIHNVVFHCKCNMLVWKLSNIIHVLSAMMILMAWCLSTRASVATVLSTQPCAFSCLLVSVTCMVLPLPHLPPYCDHMETHYWPFVRGIPRSPLDSHHNESVMKSVIFWLLSWTSCWSVE